MSSRILYSPNREVEMLLVCSIQIIHSNSIKKSLLPDRLLENIEDRNSLKVCTYLKEVLIFKLFQIGSQFIAKPLNQSIS